MGSAPDAPDLPAAPKWSDTFTYDSDGRLTGSITRDANGNTIYKAGALTAEEQINKLAINQRKDALLQRLYQTPAEYTSAAQQEADAWAANQNKAASDQFTKDVNRIGEVSNTRGLLGSKAYADILAQREKTQSETSAAIANNALSMRDSLLQNKKAQDFNLYSLYNNAANQYDAKSMQALGAASSLASQSNAFNQNAYNSEVNAKMSQYNAEMNQWSANEPWRNYIMPTLTTGAYLAASDRRLKKNIKPEFKIGDVQFYSFEYDETKWPEGFLKPRPGVHIGVMSDEVKHIPGAVSKGLFADYDMVNYDVVRNHIKMENA